MNGLRWMLIVSSSGMALGGIALAVLARQPRGDAPPLKLGPRHPVTEEMARRAKALNQKVAPYFRLPAASGNPATIGGAGGRVQFVYTIKKDCPCSVDFEPVANRFYRHFAGKVDFVGLSDFTVDEARDWVKKYSIPFPVVSHKQLEAMKKLESPASVYCTVIGKEGNILGRWAGYSVKYMTEMNEAISKELGEAARPFDAKDLPVENTSGCSFDGMASFGVE